VIGTRRKTGRRARIGWIGIAREKERKRKRQEERNSSVSFWLREESELTRAARDEKSEDELEDGRVEVVSRWEGR